MKKGCFVGKLVKETWLFICLHLRSVIPEVHEILRLTHQWQGPSTPSFLREQKDSSAHIAEAKITLMIFIFPVVHTHCPVKIEKGRSACCQISTDATLQSSPQVHVRAREWSWVQYRLQLICYSSQFHDALVWLWAMRAPELIVFLMILSQIKVCPNYTWLLLFSLKLLQVAQFLVCKTYGCLLLGKVLKCISYSTLKPGRINKSRVRHDWSDLAAAEAVLPTDSTLGRLTSYQSSSSQAFSSVQFSSAAQLCPTLCDPMDCSTPSFPILHHLPELAQTHVHWVGDIIQPSRPLSSPSPPTFNLSQQQGLFKWVSSSHQVVKGFKLQHQSFQSIFRTDFL